MYAQQPSKKPEVPYRLPVFLVRKRAFPLSAFGFWIELKYHKSSCDKHWADKHSHLTTQGLAFQAKQKGTRRSS
jgi:hypothetical protein